MVRRRCPRCGWKGWQRAEMRRCRQPRFGRGSYACWAELEAVPRTARTRDLPAVPAGKGIGWVLGEEAQVQQHELKRTAARRKAAAARRKVDEKTRKIAQLTKSLREWQRKAERLDRVATMTDAELEAVLSKRRAAFAKGRAPKARRAVSVAELRP